MDQDAGTALRLRAGATAGTLAADTLPGGYTLPTYVTSPPGEPDRLFVVQQGGIIRQIDSGTAVTAPFLDLTALVGSGGERGLLSVAFAPDYATSGRLYVYFTDKGGDIRIEEYRRGADPRAADPATRRLVLPIEHSSQTTTTAASSSSGPTAISTRPPATAAAGTTSSATARTGPPCSASCSGSTPTSWPARRRRCRRRATSRRRASAGGCPRPSASSGSAGSSPTCAAGERCGITAGGALLVGQALLPAGAGRGRRFAAGATCASGSV